MLCALFAPVDIASEDIEQESDINPEEQSLVVSDRSAALSSLFPPPKPPVEKQGLPEDTAPAASEE